MLITNQSTQEKWCSDNAEGFVNVDLENVWFLENVPLDNKTYHKPYIDAKRTKDA